MRLRPVFNKKLSQWLMLKDGWCERGETSIVATLLTGLDDIADEATTRRICDSFNTGEIVAEQRDRIVDLIRRLETPTHMYSIGAAISDISESAQLLRELAGMPLPEPKKIEKRTEEKTE